MHQEPESKDITDSTSDESVFDNPFIELIFEDISNREKWATRDRAIIKRRLGDRPNKRRKPYVGAPNFVVPIADDNVRQKTDQEISMMENARKYGYFLPLSADMDATQKAMAEMAFDSYLRYIIKISDKIEEALDCKNARGFAVIKVVRAEHERFRFMRPDLKEDESVMLPDIEVVDPMDLVVPNVALRDLQLADRLTQVYRYSEVKFKKLAKKNKRWQNVPEVLERAGKITTNDRVKGYIETLANKIGIVTGARRTALKNGEIVLYEFWHYATAWTVERAKMMYAEKSTIVLDRKCRMLFSPDAPDLIMSITKWREDGDQVVPTEEDNKFRTILAADKPWPYVQCRYENRSKYYYDSRGLAQLVMDDQIAASSTRNAKHVMMDYYQLPQFTGSHRNGPQMTHEPGSFLPEGVQPVTPVKIPATFDFTVDQFQREAARRGGVVAGYGTSGHASETRKIQKTLGEVQLDAQRGDNISSAAVNRFIGPWSEVFMQLWEDMKRLKVALPLIANMQNQGFMSEELYELPVLIIPAANAKTLNPDLQFMRDKELWTFLVEQFAPLGVTLDPDAAARDMVSHLDPSKLDWIKKPDERGPNGEQPVYKTLGDLSGQQQQMQEMLEALVEGVKALGQTANQNSERLDSQAEQAGVR